MWSLNCGDAIEDVKQAVNRHALYPVLYLQNPAEAPSDTAALKAPSNNMLVIRRCHVLP